MPETRAATPPAIEELIDSLLWEGYALYPYTPGATKNATPTPFGILYPPTYAAGLASTFDHLEMRCVAEAPPGASVRAEVRFLVAAGHGHRASDRRLELAAAGIETLGSPWQSTETIRTSSADRRLTVALELGASPLEPGRYELALRVENRTACRDGLDRAAALACSLISTHPVLRIEGGRFVSPLERPCRSVNTFPVLASDEDEVLLGAAIVLPEHPMIAPESRGGLFDSTEIEEALLLHVKTLSDGEREEIEREDPRVQEMIERAAAATPEDVLALHGRVTLSDPHERGSFTPVPPREPPGLPDPTAGEAQAEVDGVRFRRGGKLRLRPGEHADLHARMLDGRVATLERILVDYDGRTHLGVTIDGDPGQQLLRETGRLLFFFPAEVEVIET
ncbi:MAG TPA: hypothetical protein VNV44_13635 [Solirubrobacteraceae bacterium]|jgi:hypothetical protein|nr:hypothetical protein [Solirubrobacteraceae bacterium]